MIYQYWETRGTKPAYIDGLREIAAKNGKVPLTLVTPETLDAELPDMPSAIRDIEELAHKADMIRAMLVHRHGGMWLDSDAIVLKPLDRLFDYLNDYDFVAFRSSERLRFWRAKVRVNCFLSRPGGRVIGEWMRRQHAKLPRTTFEWNEIGSDILHAVCMENRNIVKFLPFETICPVTWDNVDAFSQSGSAAKIVEDCLMVMMSNKSLTDRRSILTGMTVEEIARRDWLVSDVLRHALA
ncbi:MAG TPA: capsular polysaccharide synthesis protein [Rhizomicrobium sp.]|nr:capsular polysaccharide synthesis protein [Rhizomicrobium sp.]